mgnify:CR=1 FL=1
MAARKNVANNQRARERIQTTQLINRLTNHALGKLKLEPTQVKSIEILLKKTLPDLAQMTVEGGDKPIQYAQVSSEPLTADEWLTKHGPGDHRPAHNTH